MSSVLNNRLLHYILSFCVLFCIALVLILFFFSFIQFCSVFFLLFFCSISCCCGCHAKWSRGQVHGKGFEEILQKSHSHKWVDVFCFASVLLLFLFHSASVLLLFYFMLLWMPCLTIQTTGPQKRIWGDSAGIQFTQICRYMLNSQQGPVHSNLSI